MKFEEFLNESKQKDQVLDLISPILDVKGAPSADDLAKKVEKMGQHYHTHRQWWMNEPPKRSNAL